MRDLEFTLPGLSGAATTGCVQGGQIRLGTRRSPSCPSLPRTGDHEAPGAHNLEKCVDVCVCICVHGTLHKLSSG